MSCSALKSFVASQSGYPAEFVQLINTVSEDHTAKALLDEHEAKGILAPDSDFVLNTVLTVRTFLKWGLLKAEESYLAASKSLEAMRSILHGLNRLFDVAPSEEYNPAQLHLKLIGDRDFAREVHNIGFFFS